MQWKCEKTASESFKKVPSSVTAGGTVTKSAIAHAVVYFLDEMTLISHAVLSIIRSATEKKREGISYYRYAGKMLNLR
jgi:hypothetical protein